MPREFWEARWELVLWLGAQERLHHESTYTVVRDVLGACDEGGFFGCIPAAFHECIPEGDDPMPVKHAAEMAG